MLLKDFEKSEEINHFSQGSKDLITEMGITEILYFHETFFEETMSGLRLILGNWYRILHMRKMHAGYVIKKNQSRSPGHGQTMRQIIFHKARDML